MRSESGVKKLCSDSRSMDAVYDGWVEIVIQTSEHALTDVSDRHQRGFTARYVITAHTSGKK